MTLLARARKTAPLLGLLGFLAAPWAGCDSGSEPPPTTSGTVTLLFDQQVGGDSLVFGVQRYVNAAGNHYDVDELRYYVSNAVLVRRDGSTVAVGEVHYRDAEANATRGWVLPNVPNGEYTALRFTFGLDSLRNLVTGLPDTNENQNMAWPLILGGGYHFMQLDGRFADSTGTEAWLAHMGRLVPANPALTVDPHFQVELDFQEPVCSGTPPCTIPAHGLIVNSDATEAQVWMDVNAWFATPNVYDFGVFGGFVMDNPTAQRELRENGAHVFQIGRVTGVRP